MPAPPARSGTDEACKRPGPTCGAMQYQALIDAARCVHARYGFAECRACVEACPALALRLADKALELDRDVCSGCGRCRPACPWAAIELQSGARTAKLQVAIDSRTRDAFLACASVVREQAAAAGCNSNAPCLETFGERDILDLLGRGVRRLVVSRDGCPHCARLVVRPFDQAMERIARLQASRGQAPVRLLSIDGSQWRRRTMHLARQSADLNQGLRRLLGLGRAGAPAGAGEGASRHACPGVANGVEGLALHRFVPAIEPSSCTGCDACVRVCPNGALALDRINGRLGYRVNAEQCNGCALCMDICEEDAVSIHEMTSVAAAVLPLDEQRCRACGVNFHAPDTSRAGDLCRICTLKAHSRSLFQVRDIDGEP